MKATFTFTIQNIVWTVRYGWFGLFAWPPSLAAGTTAQHTTDFEDNGYCPDAQSLAHEFYHILNTHWLRYLLSITIGRLWGSTYWKDQERGANAYEIAHATDPVFAAAANTLMAAMPSGTRFETINHPV